MVKAEHLSKKYGKRVILQDISFIAEPGEQIAFIGRNGCGKSTLMQILGGLLTPDGGKLTYFDEDAIGHRKIFLKYCGYVPQENPLIMELSVQDNISLWTGKRGMPEEELRDMFELDEILKTPVSRLSGGMKRRVSICCAAALHPKIMLMDEPTTALDYYFQDSIHAWMEDYRKKGGILLVSTHDKEEMKLSTRIIRMEDGKVK